MNNSNPNPNPALNPNSTRIIRKALCDQRNGTTMEVNPNPHFSAINIHRISDG